MNDLRRIIFDRASGICQARFPSSIAYVEGVRCTRAATDAHHVLFKSQGGRILDRAAQGALRDGTFDPQRHLAHRLALCASCHHDIAHGQPDRAWRLRLSVNGRIITDKLTGLPVYVDGDDLLLGDLWPEREAA